MTCTCGSVVGLLQFCDLHVCILWIRSRIHLISNCFKTQNEHLFKMNTFPVNWLVTKTFPVNWLVNPRKAAHVTDNCSSWISRRERRAVEFFLMTKSPQRTCFRSSYCARPQNLETLWIKSPLIFYLSLSCWISFVWGNNVSFRKQTVLISVIISATNIYYCKSNQRTTIAHLSAYDMLN